MVEACLQEQFEVIFFGEFKAVCEQAADLSVLFGVGDELGEVFAQGGLAACEDDVWNACLPGFVENGLPFLGCEFAVEAFGGGVLGVCGFG